MRLIDADVLKKYMLNTGKDVERFLRYIDEQPTAYNLDKVMEQLEKEEEESYADFERYANEHGEHGLDGEYDDWFFMGMKCAGEIMKRGGVDGKINKMD